VPLAVAHACHAIGAGCGWLRRLANAPHHPEARHEKTPPECFVRLSWCAKCSSCRPLIRLSQAQVSAILNHARALPQRDGHARPAFAGSAEGGERNLVIFDAGTCSTMVSPSGVQVSTRKAKCVLVVISNVSAWLGCSCFMDRSPAASVSCRVRIADQVRLRKAHMEPFVTPANVFFPGVYGLNAAVIKPPAVPLKAGVKRAI
jgi:hypothetical protein